MRRTTPGSTARGRSALILLSLLAVTALAACSGADTADEEAAPASGGSDGAGVGLDDAASDRGSATTGEPDHGAGAGGEAGPTADGEAGDPGVVRPAALMAGRQVIRTAEVELVAEDPEGTVEEVVRLAEGAGGFVATTDLRRDDENVLHGRVTLRVPSEELLEVVSGLEQLGVRAPVSRIEEEDVTTETTDLEARLTNLTTFESELRTLLAEVREDASSPDDLLRIFERIREVRAEIDTIEGRLASLSDQVALATVDVRVEPAPTALPVTDPTWQPLETVREAFTAAARGLGRVADVAIWMTVGVLPVVLVVAAPLLAAALLWRRSRVRTRPSAPDPAG